MTVARIYTLTDKTLGGVCFTTSPRVVPYPGLSPTLGTNPPAKLRTAKETPCPPPR